ncbi:hypothetical protein RRG08_011022 [Elysia crispata]|uniref:Uncharacterized protein n=1 Tax=Elysia crispata TaxID=231223 RepID=A0AAE0YDL6_9GAST|nr:hypothetical protein RRG08_011022 [Elysia crispata]
MNKFITDYNISDNSLFCDRDRATLIRNRFNSPVRLELRFFIPGDFTELAIKLCVSLSTFCQHLLHILSTSPTMKPSQFVISCRAS